MQDSIKDGSKNALNACISRAMLHLVGKLVQDTFSFPRFLVNTKVPSIGSFSAWLINCLMKSGLKVIFEENVEKWGK